MRTITITTNNVLISISDVGMTINFNEVPVPEKAKPVAYPSFEEIEEEMKAERNFRMEPTATPEIMCTKPKQEKTLKNKTDVRQGVCVVCHKSFDKRRKDQVKCCLPGCLTHKSKHVTQPDQEDIKPVDDHIKGEIPNLSNDPKEFSSGSPW